jgi:hypothetical protein
VTYLAEQMLEFTEGNPFAQFIHDAATLANHHKCLATGCVFVDPKYLQVHRLCLSMRPIEDGTGEVAVQELKFACHRAFNQALDKIMCLLMSDKAAVRAAKLLKQYPDTCGMHDIDKVASSGVGTLVRKDGRGGDVNPFPEGVELLKIVHNKAKHFSYSGRWAALVKKGLDTLGKPNFSPARIQLDLNETRIMAKHGLLWSACRAKISSPARHAGRTARAHHCCDRLWRDQDKPEVAPQGHRCG